MAKARTMKITQRQLRMIWKRYKGESYSDIGQAFSITGAGARATIMDGLRIIREQKENAFPDAPDAIVAALVQYAQSTTHQ